MVVFFLPALEGGLPPSRRFDCCSLFYMAELIKVRESGLNVLLALSNIPSFFLAHIAPVDPNLARGLNQALSHSFLFVHMTSGLGM
jgi:hypothetical protein